MSKRSSMMESLHGIIQQARGATKAKNSVPALTHEIMTNKALQRRLRDTRGLRSLLMSAGLSAQIRLFLKRVGDENGSATPAQVEMWPKGLQILVGEIDCARVFVPSRDEFVALVPADIRPIEAAEAGDYLIGKGRECINRGNKLKLLAGHRW